MKGYLHSIETMGLVDGPGTRTIFFLQGCPIRCAYCHNPDAIDSVGGEEVTPQKILEIARRYRPYHGQEGGVTFSGGEAMLQGEFVLDSSPGAGTSLKIRVPLAEAGQIDQLSS